MGYISQKRAKALRISTGGRSATRRMAQQGAVVSLQSTDMKFIEKEFAEEFQERVAREALTIGGKMIQSRYHQNLAMFQSKITGTRDKQWLEEGTSELDYAKGPRERRMNTYQSTKPRVGKKATSSSVPKYRAWKRSGFAIVMIGARRPWGNIANILEFGGNINLWGTGHTYALPPEAPLRRAVDGMRGHVRSAMTAFIKSKAEKF